MLSWHTIEECIGFHFRLRVVNCFHADAEPPNFKSQAVTDITTFCFPREKINSMLGLARLSAFEHEYRWVSLLPSNPFTARGTRSPSVTYRALYPKSNSLR